MAGKLTWLNRSETSFPPSYLALDEPNGLLAAGGDLSAQRLLCAYERGIFPWYEDGQPVLWWTPDPRMILIPGEEHLSRSLRKRLRQQHFSVTCDTSFSQVVTACAAPRKDATGTWITAAMHQAYVNLHELGHAHSVEVWQNDHLVGGLYGVSIGSAFFGESMFSNTTDASKVAFVTLAHQLRAWGYGLLDCQVASEHLFTLGAHEIPRAELEQMLEQLTVRKPHPASWKDNNWPLPEK